MSDDGKTVHLVTSGDDHFSVRKATLITDEKKSGPSAKAEVRDQPLPGADGGSLTVHVEAGQRERDFHITFERDGAHYLYFDGKAWSAPVQVTAGRPFRSGVHIAVAPDNTAHLAGVEGLGGRGGALMYRTIAGGKPGAVEKVHRPQGWNECDIALGCETKFF